LRFNFDGDQAQSLRFNFDGDQAKAMTNRASPLDPPPLEPFHKVIPYPPVALGLLVASLGIALAPFIVGPMTMQELRWVAGVTLLLALFTIPAYLAAWAMPHTSGDLLLYCLLAVGLALGAILVCVRSLLRSSQLVQAMAGFGGGSGAAESLNTAPLAAEASQQPLLTTPQHM
jgi:hypothetical protein